VADPQLGDALLARARNAITSELGGAQVKEPEHPALHQPGSTFVTLTRQGELRGCIGSLRAYRPLDQDVRENARAAAFRDRRFAPLSAGELAATRVEVSLLTPAEPIRFATEEDAVRQLRQGIDGVILESGGHRGTFLPQMWEHLPDPWQFMSKLKRKTGLAGDFWSKDLRLYRYEVQKWSE
jgi:AmmeMemoRadiSam system protein A